MSQIESPVAPLDKLTSLLTAQEVAQLLRIGRSTVYQLMQSGDLANIRIGRSVRVRPEDLQKFIELKTLNNES